VNDTTPANKAEIVKAIRTTVNVICYFGHGDEDSWLTNGASTLDAATVSSVKAKTIISIACRTACKLGPNAITAGVRSWLGFTIKVPIIAPHKNLDPIGDAIVNGLSVLGNKGTMQSARSDIVTLLDQVVRDYDDNGKHHSHPEHAIGYYSAMALRDHVVVHGRLNSQPLP
jgi:hypothetical protein